MSERDTELSSELASAHFATTHWSVVLAAGERELPQAAEALEKLCRAYWYPLYVYVRRQGNSPEDAQDLTQDFLSRLLRKTISQEPTATAASSARSCWDR